MKTRVAICMLCLALTTSAPAPHGNNGLKQAALHLLDWTEERGGIILSEVLLGKRIQDGRTTYAPVVITDFERFLEELSSRLAALESEAASGALAAGHSGQLRGRREVVVPPDSSLITLGYNDILDILGDYTKGFVMLIQPILLPLFTKRGVAETGEASTGQHIGVLLQTVLNRIQKMQQ